MNKDSRIYLAGHTGLVGSAFYRKLNENGYHNVIVRPYPGLDLMDQHQVDAFFNEVKPEYVILAAARVGGILANNTLRAQFIYDNLMIQNNIIFNSYKYNVKKLLFLGSSCIYPKNCPQPIKEEYLLTDELEYTNEPYAIAKIAGIKMCESYNLQYGTNFISVMPTNLFGINDNYNLEMSHVMPALIRKFHLGRSLETSDWDSIYDDIRKRPITERVDITDQDQVLNFLKEYGITKEKDNKVAITLWGTGKPRRDFLPSDRLVETCIFLMEKIDFNQLYSDDKEIRNTHVNIGSGIDYSIEELSAIIREIVGFEGKIAWDHSKPDGTSQKLLDNTKLKKLGWEFKSNLKDDIANVYETYKKND
jgi:GDP-L-fucose synthase